MSPLEDPVARQQEETSGAAAAPEATTTAVAQQRIYGAVAEFEGPQELLKAVRAVRHRGYEKLDAYTPFPVHGLDRALGLRASRLGWIVVGSGLMGTAAAVLLQWWTGAVDYPLVIGGKPFFALEFATPIMFELTVLFAAFGAVFGMLFLNGLPRFYHPVFRHAQAARMSDDRFLLAIEAEGDNFDAQDAVEALEAAGGNHVEVVAE
jgi:hypothetical protein